MNLIEHYEFGSIKVRGKEFEHDVIVSASGAKDRGLRAPEHHFVSLREVQKAVDDYKPEKIIVGVGTSGTVDIDAAVEPFLKENKIGFASALSQKACDLFNEEVNKGTKAVAIIHLTC